MKLVGYLGIFLIQLAYLPQTYKVIKTRSVKGLSPLFIFLVWLGIIFLQVYSYIAGDIVFIVSNWFGIINTSVLLTLLWRFRMYR